MGAQTLWYFFPWILWFCLYYSRLMYCYKWMAEGIDAFNFIPCSFWWKVLGTFITEWDEGRLICNKLLATKESAQMYAERLAELAIDLGFDGWLVYSLLKFRMLNLNLSWTRLNNSHRVISITFLMCLKVHAKCSLSPLCQASFDNYYQKFAFFFQSLILCSMIQRDTLSIWSNRECFSWGRVERSSDVIFILFPWTFCIFIFFTYLFSWGGNSLLQINIEVNLLEEQIPNLEEFVSHLTHTMHSSMPESLVIWWVFKVLHSTYPSWFFFYFFL